ncbi:beta strand repeat-containing protein [Alteromonas antoniana]|uniref:beta strand repeat-containing protein n=1 Tax=Alteromonas antoniana TaxID=2803813 RepID=UPI001C487DA0|nr:hypothetical protein [Alteromonas antoniana]
MNFRHQQNTAQFRNLKIVAAVSIALLPLTSVSTAFASDANLRVANTLLDGYTSQFEEADLVAEKLTNLRVATLSYWAANQTFPDVMSDLVADSHYFGSFNTTYGTAIDGTNNTSNYALSVEVATPELARYIAGKVDGLATNSTVTLQFGTPMSAVANEVSLARYADPARPDASTMHTHIDMAGNDINNAGAITASGLNITGDTTLTADTNVLSLNSSGLSYNGADVVTSDNLSNYLDTSDFVSKTEDGTLTGLYTIDGPGSGFDIRNEARINFYESGDQNGSGWIDSGTRGVSIGRGGSTLLSIGDGAYGSGLIFKPSYGSASVSIKSRRDDSGAVLAMDNDAVFKALGGETWIGASDHRVVSSGGASSKVNLAAKGGGQINMIVGQNGYLTPDYALRADNDSNANARVTLMYNSDKRLQTNAAGVAIDGALNVTGNIKATNGGVEYLNLSDNNFSYNGADVLTASNFSTYAATAEDAVSKTQDGVLRGMYSIDGLSEDGTTSSGAGLDFINGSGIAFDGRQRMYSSNGGDNVNLEASDVLNLHSGRVAKLSATKTGNTSGISVASTVITVSSRSVQIGGYGGQQPWAENVSLSTKSDLFLRAGPLSGNNEIVFLGKYDSSTGESYSQMLYESMPRLTTTASGVVVNQGITAVFDSDDDGIAETEYFNLSNSTFTYQGNQVLTAGNFSDYAASADDVVSKTKDGTLRGLYTIDGLEADGTTPSDAALKFVNGAGIVGDLNVRRGDGTKVFGVSDGYGTSQGLFYNAVAPSTSVSLTGRSFERSATLTLSGEAKIRAAGSKVFIGVADTRMESFGGSSNSVFVGAGQSVQLAVGNASYQNPGIIFDGYKDENGNGVASLHYDANQRLRTSLEGVDIVGGITANIDNGDGTETEYFTLSDSAFTYNGSDVITADNISSYAASVEDAVSKTQSGTLRGIYTIDGKEVDGTSSGAALMMENGADIYMSETSKIRGKDILSQATRMNRMLIRNGGWASDVHLEYGKVYLYGNEQVMLGMQKSTEKTATPILKMIAADTVSIQGGSTRVKTDVLRANFGGDGATVQLFYDGNARLETTESGTKFTEGLVGVSDNGDGTETEYLSLSDTAFTYNGADVLTADNVASYVDTSDLVSKTMDSTLRGVYTIDGENPDGTPNGAGLVFTNNANIHATRQLAITGDILTLESVRTPTARSSLNLSPGSASMAGTYLTYIGKTSDIVSRDTRIAAQDEVNINILGSRPIALASAIGTDDAEFKLYFVKDRVSKERLRTSSDGLVLTGSINAQTEAGNAFLTASDSEFQYNGSNVLTEANIGAMNIDADTLGGIDKSSFVRVDVTDTQTLLSDLQLPAEATFSFGSDVYLTNSPTYNMAGLVNKSGSINLSSATSVVSKVAAALGPIGETELTNQTFDVRFNTDSALFIDSTGTYVSGDLVLSDNSGSGEFIRLKKEANEVMIVPDEMVAGALSYREADNVWATGATLELMDVDAANINATTVTAQDIHATSTLTVNGLDVGQWIADCEAGIAQGCT